MQILTSILILPGDPFIGESPSRPLSQAIEQLFGDLVVSARIHSSCCRLAANRRKFIFLDDRGSIIAMSLDCTKVCNYLTSFVQIRRLQIWSITCYFVLFHAPTAILKTVSEDLGEQIYDD